MIIYEEEFQALSTERNGLFEKRPDLKKAFGSGNGGGSCIIHITGQIPPKGWTISDYSVDKHTGKGYQF